MKSLSKFFIVCLSFLSLDPAHAAMAPLKIGLKEAKDRARNAGKEILVARSEKEIQAEEVSRSFAQFFPKVSLNAATGTMHDRAPNPGEKSIPEVGRDRNIYSGKVVLTQSLFSGFKDSSDYQAQKAQFAIKEEKERATIQDRMMEVTNLYFSIQLLGKEISLEEESGKVFFERLAQVNERIKVGRSTTLEKLQAELALKNLESSTLKLKSQLEQKALQFARLIGSALDQPIELVDQLESAQGVLEKMRWPEIDQALEMALAQNTQVLQIEGEKKLTIAQNRLATSESLPKIDLEAFGGMDSFRQDEIGASRGMTYGFQLKVNIPLFSGLSSFAARREETARMTQINYKGALVRENIFETLRGLYRDWEVNKKDIDAQKTSAQMAQEIVTRAESLYFVGRVPFSEVLDSYAKRLEAKKTLYRSYLDRIMLAIQLKNIMGLES